MIKQLNFIELCLVLIIFAIVFGITQPFFIAALLYYLVIDSLINYAHSRSLFKLSPKYSYIDELKYKIFEKDIYIWERILKFIALFVTITFLWQP